MGGVCMRREVEKGQRLGKVCRALKTPGDIQSGPSVADSHSCEAGSHAAIPRGAWVHPPAV